MKRELRNRCIKQLKNYKYALQYIKERGAEVYEGGGNRGFSGMPVFHGGDFGGPVESLIDDEVYKMCIRTRDIVDGALRAMDPVQKNYITRVYIDRSITKENLVLEYMHIISGVICFRDARTLVGNILTRGLEIVGAIMEGYDADPKRLKE